MSGFAQSRDVRYGVGLGGIDFGIDAYLGIVRGLVSSQGWRSHR